MYSVSPWMSRGRMAKTPPNPTVRRPPADTRPGWCWPAAACYCSVSAAPYSWHGGPSPSTNTTSSCGWSPSAWCSWARLSSDGCLSSPPAASRVLRGCRPQQLSHVPPWTQKGDQREGSTRATTHLFCSFAFVQHASWKPYYWRVNIIYLNQIVYEVFANVIGLIMITIKKYPYFVLLYALCNELGYEIFDEEEVTIITFKLIFLNN